MNKIGITLLFLLIISPFSLRAQSTHNEIYRGFSGGMMLHSGALFNTSSSAHASDRPFCPQGATFGIGGAARVHLLEHLRIGGEGFVSTMSSPLTDCRHTLQNGSYVRSGWGGILADACWRYEKIWPYIGGSIGGGAMRSFFLVEGNQHDWQPETQAFFNRQAFFLVDPYVGMDWCMTEKVHMTFRLDWVLALHRQELLMPTGPRLYVGFMFCH